MSERIKTIQDILKNGGYHEVCIEIMGRCNAQCKYCPAGNKQPGVKRGMMEPELFEKVIDKLIAYGVIGEKSQIDLFWWGEPMLHPHLNEIIEITQSRGVDYVLSTNGFHYQNITAGSLSKMKRFIISMPGFSQDSYDRIHKFDFEKIKENICRYADDMRAVGKLDKIWVAYHIYQFNLDEMYDAFDFCDKLGISFNPGFAFPLLVKERVGYAMDTLQKERKEEMLRDIVTYQLDKMIAESDRKSCIYQTRNFIVDEIANVYGCLNLEHNDENYCGNLLTDAKEDIFKNIADLKICSQCIECGVAPTDLSFKMYYDAWYQMMKKQRYLESLCETRLSGWDKDKELMKIIMTLRNAEQKKQKEKYFIEAENLIRQNGFGYDDIKEHIANWAMRPELLWCEFDEFVKNRSKE